MRIKLSDIPMGRTIEQLQEDAVDAELDRELAEATGLTVEELNRPATHEELEAIRETPAHAGLKVRVGYAARQVGKGYAAKKNADA